MGLGITDRQIEGITILDLHGRLVAGDESSDLNDRLAAMLSEGKRNVILNLQHVSFIDSTGLGAMVRSHSTFEKAGGSIKLLHASKRHAELLVLTKLSTVFQVFDDEQAAIDSFFPDRAIPRFDILEFVKSEQAQEEQGDRTGGERETKS